VLEQAGFPPLRITTLPLPPQGMTAAVVGDVGNGDHDPAAIARAYADAEEVRLCGPGVQPDLSHVQGSAVAEVSVRVDEFSDFVVAACAMDEVSFLTDCALEALRQMAG